MNEPQTISWIFLATAMASQVEPAKFSDITQIADGINHAVPTHKELQSSIGWLVDNNLVLKQANKYTLTDVGQSIYHTFHDNSTFVSQVWSNLEKEIEKFMSQSSE